LQAESSEASYREREAAALQSSSNQGNRESSEITYEFTVETVPSDFQNDKKEDSDEESENFEMEVVEFFPAQPQLVDMGSPRKIPDLDSPKEHAEPVVDKHPHEVFGNIELQEGENKKQNTVIEPKVPKEKEEFVFTLDELSNVDFSALDPNQPVKRRSESDTPKVNYRIEFRNSLDLDSEEIQPQSSSTVHQEPVFHEDTGSHDEESFNQEEEVSVKGQCSELSFSPDYEGEAEHLMEEKSISMIALPAERTPVKSQPMLDDDEVTPARQETFSSTTRVTLNNSDPRSASLQSTPRSEDGDSMLTAQYAAMQDQMALWQTQLAANQRLLASSASPETSPGGPPDPSSLQLQQLQLQIQMQQQMLLQLQQSMATLALQTTVAPAAVARAPAPQTSTPLPEMPTMRVHSPRDTPPAPPPAPAIKAMKASKADAKYSKPKQKRFERQLDPREQLMLDIRNFGKKGLHKVSLLNSFAHST